MDRRLVVYVSESRRRGTKPLWREVLDTCRRHGLSGATATRGLVGFGASGKLHEDLTPDAMPDLPVTIEAIDEDAAIDRVLPDLDALVKEVYRDHAKPAASTNLSRRSETPKRSPCARPPCSARARSTRP